MADGMDYEMLPETAQLLKLWEQGNAHIRMGVEKPKEIGIAMGLIDSLSKVQRGRVIIDAITLVDVLSQVIRAMHDGHSNTAIKHGLD